MVWQRLTRYWKKDDRRQKRKQKRRRLLMESLFKRELLATDFASITGVVYNDANNNQTLDAGELGLANVSVSISGPVNTSTTTNAQGEYRFDNLIAGTYQVTQDPPPPVGFTAGPGESPKSINVTVGDAGGTPIVTIDDFSGPTQNVEAVSTGTNPNSSTATGNPANLIGGTRGVFVNVTSATGLAEVTANPGSNPGVLEIDPSATGAAEYTITYDGDNDATVLSPTGLNNFDLTAGGTATAVQAFLGFDIDPGSGANGTIAFDFHTDAANSTTFTFGLPDTAGAPTAEVLIRTNGTAQLINGVATANAVVTQTGGGADFTDIGAIQVRIDSDGEAAVDGIIDIQSVIGPTELTANFANDEITPEINIEKTTNGEQADTGTGPLLAVGSTATFDYTVTNPGTTALDITSILDDAGTAADNTDDFTPTFVGGDTNNNNLLDTTETWTYQATRTVTTGQYRNIINVVANPVAANGDDIPGVGDVNDNDPSAHLGVNAEINIEKFTNGVDADAPTGPELVVGSNVTFTYNVTNPGDVALATVVVTDDNGTPADNTDDLTANFVSGDANNNGLLEPGETFVYTLTDVVTAGQYTNLGSVVGNPVDAAGADIPGLVDPTAEDPSNHIGVTPEIALEKLTNGVDADTPTGPVVPVGSTATFTYNVTNPGTVALDTVTVVDDNGTPADATDDFNATFVAANSDANGNGRLDPGETFQFTATRVVTAGQYTNNAVAEGNPVDAQGQDIAGATNPTATDPSNHLGVEPQIAVQKLTNGEDADTATGPVLTVGSTATFTYNVTNPGTVALDNVTVVDDNGTPADTTDDFNATFVAANSDANGNGRLDPGETFQFTATRVVTAGQHTNIAVAEGNPVDDQGQDVPGATNPTANDPSNHLGVEPQIAIQKLTNGEDADTATGPSLVVGSTATFTYNVTNPSNVALANVTVVDDNGTPGDTSDDFNATFVAANSDANGNGRLDPGETFQFTATRVVTAGQYTNISTTSGNPVDDQGQDIPNVADPTATDPSNHIGITPQIDLQKLTNGVDADTATGPQLVVGSTATFTYNVTNPGDVPLSNVTVRDDNGTPGDTSDDFDATFVPGASDANNNGILDNGETFQFTATRTVTAGQHTNIATTTGNPVDANGNDIANVPDVTDTDPSNHLGVVPQIDVEKLTNGVDADTATGPSLAVGSTATFTYNVTNPGNVSLANVTVVDDNGTPADTSDDFNATFVAAASDANNNGRLDSGETFQFTATRVVTAGQHTNIATASGNPVDEAGVDIPNVNDPTATDPSNHIGVDSTINIEKATNGQDSDTAPGQDLDVGSTATFSYVVTGTGLGLSNVVVVDDNGTPGVTTDDFNPTFNGGDTNNNGQLDPGESWQYSATRIVTLGLYTNTATVTADNPGVGNPLTDSDASNHTGIDADPRTSSIAGTVYFDANNNGVQDAGEAGIAGVTITLTGTETDGGAAVNRTATTDANGDYLFANLAAGTYNVTETQPAGFRDGQEDLGQNATATLGDDVFTNLGLGENVDAVEFDFGELAEALSKRRFLASS